MKILLSNVVDDKEVDLRERLAFVLGELQCPVWMLGNRYRYNLTVEKRILVNRLKRIEYDRLSYS